MKFTGRYILIFLISLLLFSCNESSEQDIVKINKFELSKKQFEISRLEYDNCKTPYEQKTGHKIIIDIKNGSGAKGVAKKFSDYLRKNCYDTYYGNWNNFNESKTYLILHKLDENMITKLIELLDDNIDFEIIHDLKKLEDITLVIGKDYENFNFLSIEQLKQIYF